MKKSIYRLVLDSLSHGQRDLNGESEPFRFALTGVREAALRAGRLEEFCQVVEDLMLLGEDRREGRSRVRWGAWWPLTRIILAAGLEIPRLHPHPLALLRWGASYLVYGLRYQLGLEPRLRPYERPRDRTLAFRID